MPYHRNLRHLPNLTDREKTVALFSSPALGGLKEVLPATTKGPDRKAHYPQLMQYAVAVAARIYGSQHKALNELGAPGLWEELCGHYCELVGEQMWLPPTPPTAKQQDAFVKYLCATGERLKVLSWGFTMCAIGQARYQGNFPEGTVPDHTQPDSRFIVFGDGTYVVPFSSVYETVDEATGEILTVGSRSRRGRPRLQAQVTDPKPDDKSARGVNHVTVGTWTRSGWVILANGQALSAEVNVARDLIQRLHKVLKTGLHTVVWDRALTGWHIQDLMSSNRILVVNKPVARSWLRSDGYTASRLTDSEARQRVADGQPLPLGTSVYPRSDGRKPEVVRSPYYRFGNPARLGCQHDLWVDDGALFDVVQDKSGWLFKVASATAQKATPVPGPSGKQTLPITWRLPCAKARNGAHVFETTWRPSAGKSERPNRGPQRALHDLRPIPRFHHETFAKVHGLRNITESYNSWFKASLGRSGRAMRLDIRAQLVDHICAGTLANVITSSRDQQMDHRVLGKPAQP